MTKTDVVQLDEYDKFRDLDKDAPSLVGHKRIQVRLFNDVKHYGCHKARSVAVGHLTNVTVKIVYSWVVSSRGIRLLVFLADINETEMRGTYIGNTYPEANTIDKVYIIAGTDFGDR